MRCSSTRRGAEGRDGVALITVIVVLMALVVIATPFTISMRNESRNAIELLHQERARRDCELVKDLFLDRVGQTHPDRDLLTPLADDESEWGLDRENLPFDLEGTENLMRIFSGSAEDLQGRINLNTASIYLLANLFGRRTTLTEDLAADATSIEVRDAERFPDEGLIWIEGEPVLYTNRASDSFENIERGYELANLEHPLLANHAAGTEVLDYRSFLLATYCYTWQPGNLVSLPTVESIRNIGAYGEVTLEREALDRVWSLVTVRSGQPQGRRFVNTQRVLSTVEDDDDEENVILVEDGRYIGPGSIVRLQAGELTHYSLVLRSTPFYEAVPVVDPGGAAAAIPAGGGGEAAEVPTVLVFSGSWAVMLQEPVPFAVTDEEDTCVDVLARHPINVNTATPQVIAACLKGVGLQGSRRRIDRDEARQIAEAICAQTLAGWLELDRVLLELVDQDDRISQFHRQVVMLNALNANDALLTGGTMPFTFASAGYFQIETAVALDYRASRKEAARQFMREVVHAAPREPVMHLFHTQADFEEQRRLTREGRGYMTGPANLDPPAELYLSKNLAAITNIANTPPSLLWPLLADGREPSHDDDGALLQLAPRRAAGERVIHFDLTSELERAGGDGDEQPDRGGFESGANSSAEEVGPRLFAGGEGFVTGQDAVMLSTYADPVSLLAGPYARVWPFSIELWYRFDEIGAEHYIFDCGLQEESDRIYLFHDGKDLVFRVADVTEPLSALDEHSPLEHAEIRYDFSDLALEEGVFYHIACMAKGTKPSDMALFVDGVPRGQRSFQTRLRSPLEQVVRTDPAAGGASLVRAPTVRIEVLDATRFPRRGVLRIGEELIEYQSHDENTFFVDQDFDDRFGGRAVRQAFGYDHPETEVVELYGYSSILLSDRIPTGQAELGEVVPPFTLAIVDPDEVETDALSVIIPNTAGASHQIGRGFEFDTIDSLPLLAVNGGSLDSEAFQRNGGYAVVFSDLNRTIQVRNPEQPNRTENIQFGLLDSIRPQTPEGSLVDGFEVIRYDTFDGSELRGVTRGWQDAFPVGYPFNSPDVALMNNINNNNPQENWQSGTSPSSTVNHPATAEFVRQRAYWTENILDGIDITHPRVFVIPISVDIGSTVAAADFFADEPADLDSAKPGLIQVSLDFGDAQQNATEWIRFNTIENRQGRSSFCRDDPRRIRYISDDLLGFCFDDTQVPDPEELATRVVNNQEFRFRAQHRTVNCRHDRGQMVLPVFSVDRNLVTRPGRYDPVTLVDREGDRESAQINFAAYNDRDFPGVALGLRLGVNGTFTGVGIDTSRLETSEQDLLTQWSLESRDFTRIVKFPSGELPTNAPEDFVLGGNLFGESSPSKGCIDEVRFRSFDTPHRDFPRFARYVLQEELEEEEFESVLRLATDKLQYNYSRLANLLLEEFEIVGTIPGDASLFLIGDEIIACSQVDLEEGYVTILPEGRGLFGTEPGYHSPGEPVVVMNFPVVSLLEEDIQEESAHVLLYDSEGFPFSGAVMVDEEIIGYNRLEDKFLNMPLYEPFGEEKARGLFRGRFGTEPARHYGGSLAYLLPARYSDRYVPGCDAPELAYATFGVDAPGAFFSEVNWVEKLAVDGVDLVVLARVGGRGGWHARPEAAADLFLFQDPATPERRNKLLRQGDFLELRVFTRYGQGAFDPHDYTSNTWKYAPQLKALSVECVEPTRLYRHEEWR